jgi:hypothetical protein
MSVCVVALLLAVVCFEFFGFIVTGVLFLCIVQFVMSQRNYIILFGISFFLPLFLYGIFEKFLGIPLP